MPQSKQPFSPDFLYIKFVHFWLLLMLSLLVSSHGRSQFYPAKIYNIQDGLPSNSIYDIAQTPDGVMWFITSKGVVNYNSVSWTLLHDSLALPNTLLSRMQTAEDGSLWVAGHNDSAFVLKFLSGDRWAEIALPAYVQTWAHPFAFDVHGDSSGYSVIMAMDSNLYRYASGTGEWQHLEIPVAPSARINALSLHNGKMYACTSEGLWVYDGTFRPSPVNEKTGKDKEILQVNWKDGKMYLLGAGWLGVVSDGEFDFLSRNTGVERASVHSKHNLEIDHLDRVFYSSQTPAHYFDGSSENAKVLFVDGKVAHAMSLRIFLDRENNLWVGDYRGLFKFNLLRFKNYNKNTALHADEVSALLEKKDGTLVIANSEYLNFFRDNEFLGSIALPPTSHLRISDLAEGSKGELYIAALNGGLWTFDGKSLLETRWAKAGRQEMVTAVEWFNGQLYVATYRGVFSWDTKGIPKKEHAISGIRNLNTVDGALVASTVGGGVVFIDSNGNTKTCRSRQRKYNNVYSIIEWQGNYLVGTSNGLATVRDTQLLPFNMPFDFGRVASYCFLEDARGYLWIGTNEGVFIWDGTKLVNYNQSHGLSGNEVNRNALLQDLNGDVWIGTGSGLSHYDPVNDISYKAKPLLRFNSIETKNGKRVYDGMKLPYDDNNLALSFIGVSFIDEAEIYYRYRLNGLDTSWTYTDNMDYNQVRYTNLPPGEYEFEVQAGDDNNNWGHSLHSGFRIGQPYFSETWFISLVSVAALFLVYMLYRLRFYVVLKQKEKLKKLVRERTGEVMEKNKEIAAQNQVLKAQSEKITVINEKLEHMVFERTRQLEKQNKKLLQYAFLNSHKLRGPICTILGLMNLLKITNKEEKDEIIGMIENTAGDLDTITREIDQIWDDLEVKQPDRH